MEHIEREIFFALQVKFAAEKINATLQTRMGTKIQTGSVQTTTKAHTARSTGTWWQSQSVNGHGTSSTPGKTFALLPVIRLWPLGRALKLCLNGLFSRDCLAMRKVLFSETRMCSWQRFPFPITSDFLKMMLQWVRNLFEGGVGVHLGFLETLELFGIKWCVLRAKLSLKKVGRVNARQYKL